MTLSQKQGGCLGGTRSTFDIHVAMHAMYPTHEYTHTHVHTHTYTSEHRPESQHFHRGREHRVITYSDLQENRFRIETPSTPPLFFTGSCFIPKVRNLSVRHFLVNPQRLGKCLHTANAGAMSAKETLLSVPPG